MTARNYNERCFSLFSKWEAGYLRRWSVNWIKSQLEIFMLKGKIYKCVLGQILEVFPEYIGYRHQPPADWL